MNNLYKNIKRCKNGSEEDILFILDKFDPLLNKYSRLLKDDDAKQELTFTLIKVLKKIPIYKKAFKEDKYIINYIEKSIRNRYIAISKSLAKKCNYEMEFDLGLIPYNSNFNNIEFHDLLKTLSNIENIVIILKYEYNMKESEIAEVLHISRQAVNQAKNRAIKKLRLLCID